MTPRKPLLFVLALALLCLSADAAFAQAAAPSPSSFDISWSALDPGDDWTWQMLQSVFPVNGAPPTNTGTAATVIGTLLGQITGLVMAIAMFFLCYLTIINIHRVAESAQIMTSAMTSMAAVRIGFAAIMMFPLSSGFSVGQAGVMQVAGWGIGMARSLYANAVKAIGPDAMVIADPVIPGTRTIVLSLIENELCRSLVNQATGSTLVPAPTATTVNAGAGAVVIGPAEDDGRGILSTRIHADGTMSKLIEIPGGGSAEPMTAERLAAKRNTLRIEGPALYAITVRHLTISHLGIAPY